MWVLQGGRCAYLTYIQLLSFPWGTFPSMQKEVGVALTAMHATHRADWRNSQIPQQTPLGPCPSHVHPHAFCTYMCGGMSSLNKNPISISLTCLQMLKYHYPKHNIMPQVNIYHLQKAARGSFVLDKSSLISEGSRNGDLLGTAQRTLGTHHINIGKTFVFNWPCHAACGS